MLPSKPYRAPLCRPYILQIYPPLNGTFHLIASQSGDAGAGGYTRQNPQHQPPLAGSCGLSIQDYRGHTHCGRQSTTRSHRAEYYMRGCNVIWQATNFSFRPGRLQLKCSQITHTSTMEINTTIGDDSDPAIFAE